MSGVAWDCSHCGQSLHLAGTLWRTEGGDPFCHAAGPDVIAEQYSLAGLGNGCAEVPRARMHAPRSDWVHPALRVETEEEVA